LAAATAPPTQRDYQGAQSILRIGKGVADIVDEASASPHAFSEFLAV
jgi:hypothetical protein